MSSQLIDPVYTPQAVQKAMELFEDIHFDALQAEERLQGVVDKGAKTAAIILAGGTGERFGREGGKQLVEIAGKPVLTRSAEIMDSVGDICLSQNFLLLLHLFMLSYAFSFFNTFFLNIHLLLLLFL